MQEEPAVATNEPAALEPLPLKKGVIPMWRARCITPYNPDLLPPEPVPLQEEVIICIFHEVFLLWN